MLDLDTANQQRDRSVKRQSDQSQTKLSWPQKLTAGIYLAAWFGLVTGLIEALIFAWRKISWDYYRLFNPDSIWLAPLGNIVLFSTIGLGISLVGIKLPNRIRLQVLSFTYSFLSYISIFIMVGKLHKLALLILALGLAYQTSRIIVKHDDRFYKLVDYSLGWIFSLRLLFMGRKRIDERYTTSTSYLSSPGYYLLSISSLILALALGVRGIQRYQQPKPNSGSFLEGKNPPNVLLIVMDTLRSQNMSLYGYDRRTTPNLETLAESGVVFNRAFSTTSWTLPSHASLFTGRWAQELSADWQSPLDDTFPTLAEYLRSSGYRTAGFSANLTYCNRQTGIARGFQHYEDYEITVGQTILSTSIGRFITSSDRFRDLIGYHELLNRKTAEDVNRSFLNWVERQSDIPFFAFLNYFDAHEPYLPPPQYNAMFGSSESRRGFEHTAYDAIRKKWLLNSPDKIQVEVDAYDGTIAYIDQQIGDLMNEMESSGLLENTLIIITSDHGEEFNEHGVFEHGNNLYLTTVQIPLLLLLPEKIDTGVRIDDPVSLRDIPATVVGYLGLKYGSPPFPGNTLERYWSKSSELTLENVLPLMFLNQNFTRDSRYPMNSIIQDQYQYIRHGDGSEELYNIETDPWQTNNLAKKADYRPKLISLRGAMDNIITR